MPPAPRTCKSEIYDHFVDKIIDGSMSSGERFPSRASIEKLFRTTPVTVQRAFDELIQSGFAVVNGKQGTYVPECLPHKNRFGVLLPNKPSDKRWVNFWSKVVSVVQKIEESSELSFSFYYDLQRRNTESDYEKLLLDLKARRLGGVIIPNGVESLIDTPIFTEFSIPRVVFHDQVVEGAISVLFDNAAFSRMAVEELVRKKRHKIAIITAPFLDGKPFQAYQKALSKNRICYKKQWAQMGSFTHREWVRNLTHAIFQSKSERPDGLIIADDNFTQYVYEELDELGVNVPDDVTVVSHCSFPIIEKNVYSNCGINLGFNISNIFDMLINLLKNCKDCNSSSSVKVLPEFAEKDINVSCSDV